MSPAPTRRRRPLALGVLLTLALMACSGDRRPVVDEARIRLPPPGAPVAAGYFRVRNPGATALQLRVLGSPAFESVQIHETVTENGVASMRALDHLDVPAGVELSLAPGGAHLMLFGARQDLTAVRDISVQLQLTAPDGSVTPVEARFVIEAAAAESHHEH